MKLFIYRVYFTSSESDNLGSTDSEVKKILSLHLPISEYDSLDESDDDSAAAEEMEAAASDPHCIDSPPTFAESVALTRAHIHHHKGGGHHHGGGDRHGGGASSGGLPSSHHHHQRHHSGHQVKSEDLSKIRKFKLL